MKKHFTIWQNVDLNLDEWRDDLKSEYFDAGDDPDDNELLRMMYKINDDYLDDERENLDIKTDGEIICIADLGLWNGRRAGYKFIPGGKISDCLYDNDCYFCEWYVDGRGDFRFTGHHHDGVNHYLYRILKRELSAAQIENFIDKLYDGTATKKDITRYTRRAGDYIADVYGWNIPKRKEA